MIVFCGSLSTITAFIFNWETNNWEKVVPRLNFRHEFCSRGINEKIYFVGGRNASHEILSSVEIVNKKFHTTKASSMSMGRANFGICEFGDRFLLVAGGIVERGNMMKNKKYTKSCEIYDSFTNKWEKTSDLIAERGFFPLVVFNEKVLAIGGDSKNYELLDTIESFDLKTKKWETWPAKLLQKRWGHGAVSFDDGFYVFGGCSKQLPNSVTSVVEMYSVETCQFTFVKPIPTPIYNVSCCKKDGRIYVFGRNKFNVKTKDVQIYFTELDVWSTGVGFPDEVEILTACNV